jgi:hypothetical protein
MSEGNKETTSTSHLRVVDIKPPEFKDPATMLRNIADDIEKGQHGKVNTLAIAMFTEEAEDGCPLALFGGGRDSDPYHVAAAYGAAQVKLLRVLSGDNP